MRRIAPLLAASTAAVLATSAGAARDAHANGVNTHTWISFHAIEHLPDGELKRLMSDPALAPMIINGSIFPDGGYAVDSPFGETAHWGPFHAAFVRWMQDNLPEPYARGEARPYVAFLMGVASHGMADQVFDSMFMEAARGYDAANWSDTLLDSFDTATDVMLVDSTQVDYRGTELWLPSMEMPGMFAEVGVTVDTDTLLNAQSAMHNFILAYGAVNGRDPEAVTRYRTQYPWASEHLMDPHEPGSPPCEGEVVAAYWLTIWDRLHGVDGPENMIIATYPPSGSDGHPTDHTRVEAQTVVVFGHGIGAGVADKIRITDSTGKTYGFTARPFYSEANAVAIRPTEDWASNEIITVAIAAGVQTVDGFAYDAPFEYSFTTRPASGPRDPTTDPTPHDGEPWTPPPGGGDSGGCDAGGGAGLGAVIALLAQRRNRRRKPQETKQVQS
jgi:hypothetical protein